MNKLSFVITLAVPALAFGTPANATIDTVFDSVPAGTANFNNTVGAAGGTPTAQTLVTGQSAYADFTISKAPIGGYGGLTGSVTDIAPNGPNTIPRANPLSYIGSGITFTFTNSINAIGFEVGDWGTCCQPSALYISFDGGSPIQVGLSTTIGDVFFNGVSEVFVGAFDDSGQFSSVSFWGDGVNEALYAGGTVRYALLDQGSLPGAVPEPVTWAMMILGFAFVGSVMRTRRRLQATVTFAL